MKLLDISLTVGLVLGILIWIGCGDKVTSTVTIPEEGRDQLCKTLLYFTNLGDDSINQVLDSLLMIEYGHHFEGLTKYGYSGEGYKIEKIPVDLDYLYSRYFLDSLDVEDIYSGGVVFFRLFLIDKANNLELPLIGQPRELIDNKGNYYIPACDGSEPWCDVADECEDDYNWKK